MAFCRRVTYGNGCALIVTTDEARSTEVQDDTQLLHDACRGSAIDLFCDEDDSEDYQPADNVNAMDCDEEDVYDDSDAPNDWNEEESDLMMHADCSASTMHHCEFALQFLAAGSFIGGAECDIRYASYEAKDAYKAALAYVKDRDGDFEGMSEAETHHIEALREISCRLKQLKRLIQIPYEMECSGAATPEALAKAYGDVLPIVVKDLYAVHAASAACCENDVFRIDESRVEQQA